MTLNFLPDSRGKTSRYELSLEGIEQSKSYGAIQKDTQVPSNTMMKFAKSIGTGVIENAAAFGLGISGFLSYRELCNAVKGQCINDRMIIPLLVGGSTLYGLASSVQKFRSISNDQKASEVSQTSRSSSSQHTTLQKITKSVGTGIKNSAIIFGLGIEGFLIYNGLINHKATVHYPSLLTSTALVGLGSAVKKFTSLSNQDQSPQSGKLDQLPTNKNEIKSSHPLTTDVVTNDERYSRIKNHAKSIGTAVIDGGTFFVLGLQSLYCYHKLSNQHPLIDPMKLLGGASLLVGLGSAAIRHFRKKPVTAIIDTQIPSEKIGAITNIATSIVAGLKYNAVSTLLGMGGLAIYEALKKQAVSKKEFEPWLIGGSVLIGAAKTISLLYSGGPSLKTLWNGLSKSEKAEVIDPNLQEQGKIYKSIQKDTQVPSNTMLKLAKSIGIGVLENAAFFGLGITGILGYEGLCDAVGGKCNPPSEDIILPIFIGGSTLYGLVSSVKTFRSLSNVTIASEDTPLPSDQYSTMQKITSSVRTAIINSAITLGLGLEGFLVYSKLINPNANVNFPLLIGCTALVGLGSAVSQFVTLSNETKMSLPGRLNQPPTNKDEIKNSNSVTAAVVSNDDTYNKIKDYAKLLGYAVIDGGTVGFSGAESIFIYDQFIQRLSYKSIDHYMMLLLGASVLVGLNSAFRQYRKKIIAKTAIDTQIHPEKMSTITEIATSTLSGLKYNAVSLVSCLAGVEIYAYLTQNLIGKNELLPLLMGGSALIGTAKMLYSRGPSLRKLWNGLSKIKKNGVIATTIVALAALGTLFIGPQKVAKNLSQVARNVNVLAQTQFYNTVYTTKTEPTSKTIGDWIRGYSDIEEMERIARLSDGVPCAEILFTCDLKAQEKNEKSKKLLENIRKKLFKFHPDKNLNNKDVATRATEAINQAKDTIKKEGDCPAPNKDFCEGDWKQKIKKAFGLENPYSDQEEMIRIASLPKTASCGEVLWDCDFQSINQQENLKKYLELYNNKTARFNPKNFKTNIELAINATQVLKKAFDIMDKEGDCPEKTSDDPDEESYCDFVKNNLEFNRTLWEPHPLYRKLMGKESLCYLSNADGASIQTKLEDCSDMMTPPI